jgi:hypothetical protein
VTNGMNPGAVEAAICPDHAEHLARFRIPVEMLIAAGVRSVTDAEARETLGIKGHRGADLGGILFPYLSPITGDRVGGRIRLDHPLPDDGSKYISEPGCRHLFFPPTPKEWLADPTVPVVIVEAEKSGLACKAVFDRAGRPMLVLAIGSCWGFRRKTGKRTSPDGHDKAETGPSPDFDMIIWQGRLTILSFDSNALTNPNVQRPPGIDEGIVSARSTRASDRRARRRGFKRPRRLDIASRR